MALERERIIGCEIEEEMKTSYLNYSMSVIVGRALPDVRDGLKPVHRRILYAMSELGMAHNKPYKKSARIVGEVMGKFHPHGDQAIYDSMVRMAQEFSLRYMLVDGQGNFGSVDGDPPAAQRYTEARLSRISAEVLKDIDKDTVKFVDNYDGSLQEPSVLPSLLPGLLVNGSSGIAVGMATNIPPHNLGEVCDAVTALIDEPELKPEKLLKIVKGPDFPTGGMIMGVSGIRDAYLTGRGKVVIRGKVMVETAKSGKEYIIISELPYEVNKASLIGKVAELVRDKKLDGIADINDESDRDGMRVVITMKRDADPRVTINQLYQHTQLQNSFGVIMLALVDGVPKVLNLHQVLNHFIDFRVDVVTRRTRYELAQAEKRAHILEGLKIAIENIDEVVRIIKKSANVEAAKESLRKKFKLSEEQAQAILDMTLKRLTSLETKKIEEEYEELIKLISKLKGILDSKRRLMGVIREEIAELKKKYGDERRTKIVKRPAKLLSAEDLVADEDSVLVLTQGGYIKRTNPNEYRRQKRGGVGVVDLDTKEEDFVTQFLTASAHSDLLFFSDRGKVYSLKMYDLPEGRRATKGKSIMNFISLEQGEQITSILAMPKEKKAVEGLSLLMTTQSGTVKRVAAKSFYEVRRSGLIAIGLDKGDSLISAQFAYKGDDAILVTAKGQSIRFRADTVREMGRQAAGVRGMKLGSGDSIVGAGIVPKDAKDAELLVLSSTGYGKKTKLSEYKTQGRGGSGVKTMSITPKTKQLVGGAIVLAKGGELVAMSKKSQTIRTGLDEISTLSRATQGVRVMKLREGDQLASFVVFEAENGTA
ncbi:TPA: DNA gyrase subunit A [Candidatus Edwardsbacteria bacterium]|nr:DNA gyrase subunit A [Candidatus Edwardsbacteria bacterium]